MMTVPCELEKVMLNETKEMIKNRYDHIDGVTELWKILNTSKNKSGESLLVQRMIQHPLERSHLILVRRGHSLIGYACS